MNGSVTTRQWSTAGLAGLVAATTPMVVSSDTSGVAEYLARVGVHYHLENVSTPITAIEGPVVRNQARGLVQPRAELGRKRANICQRVDRADREARTQALRALFEWIDAQPPVPPVPLEAMDRDDIY